MEKILRAKDYTVSGEFFDIMHCNDCTAGFTQNIPSAENIDQYYHSAKYISHSDARNGFVNRMYHLVRHYTIQSKKRLISKTTRKIKGDLLDIGAGTGAFAAAMKDAGWSVTGLEPDETARNNALNIHHIELQASDNLFSLPEKEFDVITLWHVLEHVQELHAYLDTFEKILNEDGTIFIAVPNCTSHDAALYKEYWAAYDVPRHLYHFSPKSMHLLMEKHGFYIAGEKPMWFDSFYVSLLSEKYKSGKSNILKAVWNGFLSDVKAIRDVKRCSSVIYIVKKRNENSLTRQTLLIDLNLE